MPTNDASAPQTLPTEAGDTDRSHLCVIDRSPRDPEPEDTPQLGLQAQAILDAIPSPAMLIDAQRRILAANQALLHVKNMEPGEVIGQTCPSVIHCTDEPIHGCPLDEAVRTGRSSQRESLVAANERWIRSEIHPTELRTPADEPIFLHIAHDITDGKIADQQAMASAERLSILYESAPDGYYLSDLTGRFLDGNRAAEEIVGYKREELIGKNYFDLNILSEDQIPKAIESLMQAMDGQPTNPMEYTLKRKDGTLVDVEIKTFPVCIQDEDLLLGMARDITERKLAEAKRRELEEQLRQSQKIDAVGRLAGGVAHDFNNLLTVIKSCLMFIRESMNSLDPVLEDVEEAEKATQRAVALTRQLLAFSRQQVAKPEVVDLNQVVANLGKMLHRLVGEDIRIVTELSDDLQQAKIDVGHMEQVLVNLVVNARDAMPTGGILRIHTENFEIDEAYAERHLGMLPGQNVLISVKDTGVGMSQEVIERVFEPFYTTKGTGHGTGLGLSTVYGIVKQAGGYILAESEEGRGSAFRIYLPVHQGEVAEDSDPPAIDVASEDRARIILVEDDPPVRRAAARILSEHGHDVSEAGSCREAIAMLEAQPSQFDLVVTDVVMPDMSGKDLADWIEANCLDLPILFMSGYTDEVIARHGVLEEGVWLLEKPFSKRSMVKMVSGVLNEARRQSG